MGENSGDKPVAKNLRVEERWEFEEKSDLAVVLLKESDGAPCRVPLTPIKELSVAVFELGPYNGFSETLRQRGLCSLLAKSTPKISAFYFPFPSEFSAAPSPCDHSQRSRSDAGNFNFLFGSLHLAARIIITEPCM